MDALNPIFIFPYRWDLSKLPYPVYGTPKTAGVRCLTTRLQGTPRLVSQLSVPVLKRGQDIPCINIWQTLASTLQSGFDGELVQWDNDTKTPGSNKSNVDMVLNPDNNQSFRYLIYDFGPERIFETMDDSGYLSRIDTLSDLILPSFAIGLHPKRLDSAEELLAYEATQIQAGWLGIAIRTANAKYRFRNSSIFPCFRDSGISGVIDQDICGCHSFCSLAERIALVASIPKKTNKLLVQDEFAF